MKKKLKRTKRGVINLPFVMFILIFGLVLFITLEYYNIYTHQDFINTELDRNLNLTLNSSVKDSTILKLMRIKLMKILIIISFKIWAVKLK